MRAVAGWRRRSTGVAVIALIAILGGCAQPSGDIRSLPQGGRRGPGVPSSLTVDALSGMSREELTAALGPPSFSRRDGPGELAQYRAESCVLDVFLYLDDADSSYRVNHVEARTPTLQATPSADCFARVVKERRQPGA